MNKAERMRLHNLEKELEATREAAARARALSWTVPVEPDVKPPEQMFTYAHAWSYSIGGAYMPPYVYRSWSGTTNHGKGWPTDEHRGAQGPIMQYSTFERAKAALRHDLERRAARQLRLVDLLTEDGVERG